MMNMKFFWSLNKALEKISDRFNLETVKLEQAVKAQTSRVENESDKKIRNTLFFLGGLVIGAALAIIIGSLVYALKH